MKHSKIFSIVFGVSAIVLLCVMCAVVAFEYASLLYCEMCSAPPSVAFYLAIPFAIAIAICFVLYLYFNRKERG